MNLDFDKEKILSYFEVSLEKKLGALFGVVALVVGVYYFAFYSSLSAEVESLESDVANFQKETIERTNIIRNMPHYERQVELLDVELKKAMTALPNMEEIDVLLLQISNKARDAGLNISEFRPGEHVKREFYAEVPISLRLGGTFHEIATFFDEISHLERLVNIGNYTLGDSRIEKGYAELEAVVTAKAFRFLEESERPQPVEERRRGRRGRR